MNGKQDIQKWSAPERTAGIRWVYRLGLTLSGLLLVASTLRIVSEQWSGSNRGIALVIRVTLLSLWSVPVLGLFVWAYQAILARPKSIVGWLAAAMALVMISLWL